MKASRKIILVAIVLIAIAVYNPVSAKEIVVGDDSGANFSTIQEAVNNSSPGDAILILPGTYNESVDVKVEGLSILSESGNPEDTIVTTFIVRANNVTISGFRIDAGINGEDCFNCMFSDNIFFDSGIRLSAGRETTNVTIAYNTIQDGFIGVGGSSGNTIINNTISNTIPYTKNSYGITFFESHSNIIENNSISNSSYGISMAFLTGNNIVTNNTLTSNTVGILIDHLSPGNLIKNNTIANNNIGISIWNSCSGTLVIDNRIELNKEYGIYLEQTYNELDFNGSSLIYNNLFNNTVSFFNNTKEMRYGEPTTTFWNTTKTPGTSIVGGTYLGGNYWAKPDGTGFSQICADVDGDGIADLPYNINGSEIDYLPLVSIYEPQKPGIPVANFSTTATQGIAPLEVQFTDLSQNIVAWSWDFDNDGILDSASQNPVHVYEVPGNYTVNLTVSNGKDKASKTLEIIVQEAKVPPVADFRANVTSGNIPLSVLFTDLSQNATAWSWDFNNDGIADSTYKNPVYVYTYPGNYTVNLTVSNTKGTASKSSTITASPAQRIDGQLILTEYQLTTNESTQYKPSIYDDRIVWEDERNGNDDLYLYNISMSTETQITNNEFQHSNPVIYGDRIVWLQPPHIYIYNLSNSTESYINTSIAMGKPDIYGDRVVWEDYRSQKNKSDIYMYNIPTSTESQITTNESYQDRPAIQGDRIVWEDLRNGNWDIYMYDLSTSKETQITSNASDQVDPAIYGNIIVWVDNRNGNSDIYMYNLSNSTESTVTTHEESQFTPAIYGDRIIWGDSRGILMYDLSTSIETNISDISSSQDFSIYGDRIVWADLRNGNYDIYMCTISSKESEPETPVADFTANVTSGNAPLRVLFTDNSTGSPNSWLWDFGDGIYSKHAMNATHTFTRPGKYNVSLTVENANGNNTITKPGFIVVEALKVPVANFSASPTSGNAPLKVLFTDTSTGSPTSWLWDFGDGIYSKYAMNATHTFTSPGVYNVTLTVTNAAGQSTKEGHITVNTAEGEVAKPVASFYSPEVDKMLNGTGLPLKAGDPVSFFDSSTGSPTSWFWDFGDGNTSTQQNPTHVYGKTGVYGMGGYTVNLTVTNSAGSDTINRYGYVLIGADEMTHPAYFSSNVTSGIAPLTVLFHDTTYSDATGDFAYFRIWDFGDGTQVQATSDEGKNLIYYYVNHTYKKPGKYTVTLMTHDPAGKSVITKYNYITVTDNPVANALVAAFTADVTSGNAPLKALFTDTSTGGVPTSWYWDFGDGIYSKHAMNATHTFTKPGTYNITLMVTNAAGSSSRTRPGYITVTEAASAVEPVADLYSPEAENVLHRPSDHGIYESEAISFCDNSTGSPTSWKWDFGDGNTSTKKNPTHVYGKMGGYTVNLTVKNTAGSDTISKYGYVLIGIGDEPASPAYFSSDVTSESAPLKVTFHDDDDGKGVPPIWRQWDFGDGVIQSYMVDNNASAIPYATHIYEKPGKYTVTLYLDNHGGKSIITKYHYITVTSPDTIPDMPVVTFSANVTSGNAPLKVLFTDKSTGSPASWYWDFGDGIYSKHAMNATHTFTRPGKYTVTLTVKNAAGRSTAKKNGYITVKNK